MREFAVTDQQFELIRRIPVRTPYTTPAGVPYIISQPCSKVIYSHGGHLVAVVTGKIAQIYKVHERDYYTSNIMGNAVRIMVLCDHVQAITDIMFSDDDSHVYTTANDGSVYSWIVGGTNRDKEYTYKGKNYIL